MIAGHAMALHEGTPPGSAAQITSIGDSGIIYGGFQFEGALYVKAVTDAVTATVYGRMNKSGVTGDWISVKSATVAAGSSSVTRMQLSDGLGAFNEFKIEWVDGGGSPAATCQVGIIIF